MMPMTKIPGVPDRATAKPGMAFFSGTGPAGYTCGSCLHRGGWRKVEQRNGDVVSRRTSECQAFFRLTGRHGPNVAKEWLACKYFEKIPESKNRR
jgi:hypothetical protein